MSAGMLLASFFVLTLLTFLNPVNTAGECPDKWFSCGNGKCVPVFWVCDGDNECGNWADEKDCDDPGKHIKCSSNEFQCDDKSCIPVKWLCDGGADCADGSDETRCENSTCDGFKCSDGQCLPTRWKCDGQKDCSDGGDESVCHSNDRNLCDSDEFSCSSGLCLSFDKVCDHKKDCSDGSDEGDHCGDRCSNNTCQHGCNSTPLGPKCYCNEGYKLNSDNKSCSDINECLEDGFCSQKCLNRPGSYSCLCQEGYELKNKSCYATGSEPLLVFSTLREIRGMRLRSGEYFPIYKALDRSTAVDVDPSESRVYWTELSIQSKIYSVGLDGLGFKSVINNGLVSPEDIAVDYIARNLYITDSGLKQVLVCKMDGSVCSPLHKTNVYKPRALALDLPEGLLYWSDWGDEKPGIQRSNLDGTRRTTLVSSGIHWPNGITIDHSTNRLYWCDAHLFRIEYITLDGKKRKIVLEEKSLHPYAISVFEDKVYWSDWDTFTLRSCNKFTGHQQQLMTKEKGKRIMGVHVYHPVLAKKVPNPCWMNTCSHICVIGQYGRLRCICPPGFKMNSDNKTCTVDFDSPHIFVSEKADVYHMQSEGVGNDIMTKLPINHLLNAADVAYNKMNKLLYISDTQRNAIIQVNLTNFRKRDLVANHLKEVQSLDYDWLGKNLYWADAVKGTVEVYSTTAGKRSLLLSNLSRPIAIALVPERGIMFVSEVGTENPHVDMYDMNGENKKSMTAVSGATVSLALHPSKPWLFWSDQHTRTISSINYLDPLKSKKVLKHEVPRVTSIAVGENFLYWMELSSHKVNLLYLHSEKSNVHHLAVPGNFSKVSIGKINYFSGGKGGSTACKINNGGCSHVCLVKPSGHACNCPEEMILLPNSKTCTVKKECEGKDFKCPANGRCIPLDFRCDGTSDCEDSSDEHNCDLTIKCPAEDFECANGHCIPTSWKCDFRDDCGDNSDEQNCPTVKPCSANKFSCGNGQCIPDLWHCDNETDCVNGRDEESCHESKCKVNQMRCHNGQCIPLSWRCDGSKDCVDNSDEEPEKCGTSTPSCLSDDFRCDDGDCIDHKLLCDHRKDCADNSDEKNCVYNTTCKKEMFQCNDGTCIYKREVCDGYADCDNDEHQNCSKIQCSNTEFYCSEPKRCIPQSWLCDGHADCEDGSDENLFRCPQRPTPKPKPESEKCNQFTCQSRECLSWNKVCDGVPDCSDYSDEGNLCVSSCGKTNGGCSHLCTPSPTGPRCSCLAGYVLSKDGKACSDINECEIPGLCSQFCNNTKGGFKCSCADGYFLTIDQKKCKADGGAANLVYLLADRIRGLELHTHTQRVYVMQEHTDMRGFDYDAEDGVFFWSDWKEDTISRYSISTKRNSVLLRNLNRPYFIKWDWIEKNMYVSTAEGNIVACSANGEFCAVVMTTSYRHLNSIEIAPLNAYIFWSVWTDSRKTGLGLIERANMDGSGRIQIVSERTYWPSSLAVDNVLKTIYWTDVKTNVIEVTDYHGLNRRVIVNDGVSFPFGMTVFEDYVYWANWGTDQLFRSNKFTGDDKLLIHFGDVKSETITIVHKVKQPKGVSRCYRSLCPQMCLPKPTGFTCVCDKKFEMKNGNCVLKPRTSLPNPGSYGAQATKRPKSTPLDTTVQTSVPGMLTPEPEISCDDSICLNGGKCFMIEKDERCRCPSNHFGPRCEHGQSPTSTYDYSWVVALFLCLASIALIIMIILVCRQNRNKLTSLSDSLAVTFRNPRYGFRKRTGLVMDTDDGCGADELMLGKKGAYTSTGFGNPAFNQRPYLDPSPEDYKSWPSYDSDDSAFVSELHCSDESKLSIEHTQLNNTGTSKDRVVKFFKRL